MPFCRITGGSRALPKPNYFPLLPPISPADAKRFCRITGKAIGLPGHHYIPVLVGVHASKEHCHITQKSEGNESHHYLGGEPRHPRKHIIRPDYRYVFPVLDTSPELLSLLETKGPHDLAPRYVYTVDERRTSLVFSSRLEAAVRDGDVRDVMLARDADHVLLKLRRGKNVSLDVRDYPLEEDDLWEGEGPGEVAFQRDEEERRKKKKRDAALGDRKRIFEAKDEEAEREARRMALHKSKVMKVKVGAEKSSEPSPKKPKGPRKWNEFEPEEMKTDAHLYLSTGELQELAKPLVGKFDPEQFSKEAPITGESTVTVLPAPLEVPPEVVDLETSSPGIVQQPNLLEEVGGIPTVHAVTPFAPLVSSPSAEVQAAIDLIDPGSLPRSSEVKAVLMEETPEGEKLLNTLPRIEEIPDIVNMLESGSETELGHALGPKVHGLKLDISAAQRFVIGQTVDTPSGKVFVPGQAVQTANGPVFMPGITVHTPDGPLLIPGQTVLPPEMNGNALNIFVVGQNLPTRDGDKFVQGQMLYSADDEGRFVPGQTVLTPDGPRFVPGQVVQGESGKPEFVVGQTVMTPQGPQFVPGQTLTTPSGESFFLPGQSVEVDKDGEKVWEFVPGQTAQDSNGDLQFVPGQSIVTNDGPKFVAGQTVIDLNETPRFVPGVTVREGESLKFVPGTTLDTPDGLKFIEGQVVKTEKGMKFSPGKFCLGPDGVTVLEFSSAANLQEISFSKSLPQVLPIDPATASTPESKTQKEEILGHMVQTSHGVEFFPGKATGLPSGKVIQGKLIKSPSSGAVQFVPGMVHDGIFIPGQFVMTEQGEQFVPGQVVDTSEGPKFVPGQVVETHAGPKFLPGQTVITPDGPRFVPGQIIETKAGPTFIPGQVICTELEGSRFVPGQIVETKEGPRFVPGRVIETGDKVTFVPGQIVETADGLRFVAPDLQDTEEGGFEFSLQGFEVTPEELRLMRPHLVATASVPTTTGEMSIDSRMLRQLSHAGMVVGKHVPAELPGVDVASLPTLAVAEQLGLEGVAAVKMGQVLETVLKLSCGLLDERGHIRRKMSITIEKALNSIEIEELSQEEEALKNMLTEAIVMACITLDDHRDQVDEPEHIVLQAVSNFFNSILESVPDKDGVVDALHGFVTYPGHVGLLCRETVIQLGLETETSKADLLRSLLWGGEDVHVRLAKLLEQDIMGQAFLHLAEAEPELLGLVLQKVAGAVREVETDEDATEALQRAIVCAVRESSVLRLQEMMDDYDELALRELLLQAVNLARALGMTEAAQGLLAVLSDPSATRVLAGDRITLDILQRLTVMRQLAERRPKFNLALGKLVSDPEMARNDPRLRELVRESAALMVVPEDMPALQSSTDIPMALFQPYNSLAMEDFMHRRGPTSNGGALLIVRHGVQMVYPREAARDVLTGQISYTLVDEKGVKHFPPMHVFNALRLSQPMANRYQRYHDHSDMPFASYGGSLGNSRGNSVGNSLGTSAAQSVGTRSPTADNSSSRNSLEDVEQVCLRCIHGDHNHGHGFLLHPDLEHEEVPEVARMRKKRMQVSLTNGNHYLECDRPIE